jgi:hypothetical protein
LSDNAHIVPIEDVESPPPSINDWLIDSGATNHMTLYVTDFEGELSKCDTPVEVTFLLFGVPLTFLLFSAAVISFLVFPLTAQRANSTVPHAVDPIGRTGFNGIS